MSKHDKQASMDLAESARQTKWQHPSFTAELFKGSFRWDLIHPYPRQSDADKAIGDAVLVELEKCLKTHINPDEVDKTGVLPGLVCNQLCPRYGTRCQLVWLNSGMAIRPSKHWGSPAAQRIWNRRTKTKIFAPFSRWRSLCFFAY